MTDDPSQSNPTCSQDSTLEESMWHILSFEKIQKKGSILVWPLGGFLLAFQPGLLEVGLYLLVLNFCLAKSVFGTLSQLSLILSILESLCKKKPLEITIISKAKNRRVQNPSEGFFTFSKINVQGMDFCRSLCHELLGIVYQIFIPYG